MDAIRIIASISDGEGQNNLNRIAEELILKNGSKKVDGSGSALPAAWIRISQRPAITAVDF
jgi:hypothetical protein